MSRSLGTASSNQHRDNAVLRPPCRESSQMVLDGEAAPSDWRWWANRAYRAWAARQEQLNLFEAPLFPEVRYSQIRALPGSTFEDIFEGANR